jgi:hypothetical protein
MKRVLQFLLVVLVLTNLSSPAFAGRVWYYSDIMVQGEQLHGSSALAMAGGNIWPTVATEGGVAMMTPAGWVKGPVDMHGMKINAASAADGSVGFVSDNGQVAVLTNSGWSSSYVDGGGMSTSIAFNSDSNLGILHQGQQGLTLSTQSGFGWQSSPVSNNQKPTIMTDKYALGYDSYNQSVIAFDDGGGLRFGVKGVLTGHEWVITPDGSEGPSVSGPSTLDMAMSVDDIPHVAYSDGGMLKYATYDRQTASIVSSTIDFMESGPFSEMCFSIESDGVGGVGIAYISDSTLRFAYNGGNGWEVESLRDALSVPGIGLAFDEENNPVISYVDAATGKLTLAYDPIVPVPEPASIALLGLGAIAVIRRKRG